MAHGDAREGKWRGNWRMEWVASNGWRRSDRKMMERDRDRERDISISLQLSWNLMAHGDARERKWRGNWRMELVASTLHTTSEHGVSSITTADAHTSAASSPLNWRPSWFKWTRPFRRKTKSGFCACAITFQTQSNSKKIASASIQKFLCGRVITFYCYLHSAHSAIAVMSSSKELPMTFMISQKDTVHSCHQFVCVWKWNVIFHCFGTF